MIKIYLAGTIYEDQKDICWKQTFIDCINENLNGHQYMIFDPSPPMDNDISVVPYDKRTIESCQYVVAYIKKASFGTAMEIKHAFDKQGITIYTIDPDGINLDNIWLKYHSHKFFRDVKACAYELIRDIPTMRVTIL